MKVLIRFWNEDGLPANSCRHDPGIGCSFRYWVHPSHLRRFIKTYKVIKWRVVWGNRITCFFSFFGSQNDYLFPVADQKPEDCPYPKPHLWKTRFGFKTARDITEAIYS